MTLARFANGDSFNFQWFDVNPVYGLAVVCAGTVGSLPAGVTVCLQTVIFSIHQSILLLF
jgi:hypothetical protein